MNYQDEPDVFGAREPTPVEEELWSLKVVMAKTGRPRLHSMPTSRWERSRRNGGWATGEWLGLLPT